VAGVPVYGRSFVPRDTLLCVGSGFGLFGIGLFGEEKCFGSLGCGSSGDGKACAAFW